MRGFYASVKLFLFLFLATSRGLWDLSSPTRIEPRSPAVETGSLNHWTARKFPNKAV